MGLRRFSIGIALSFLAWSSLAEITGMLDSPGGSNGEVQFNGDGTFGGDSTLSFSTSTKVLSTRGLSATWGVTAATGTFSSLTSGRVPVASTGGLLLDFSGFTHNGTTLTVAGLSNTGNASIAGLLSITGALSAATLDTGQGANELYDMNQNVQTTDAVTFGTVDTGQGANELYDMNQNVQTGDSVVFGGITDSALTNGRFVLAGASGVLADDADFTHNGTTASLAGVSATNASVSGGITTGITGNRAVQTNASNVLEASAVTSTELGYVSGVTSAIQAQINALGAQITVASQAEQEAGTSTTTFVSPGRQQYHPSAAKAWVNFNSVGTVTIRASYNISSLTDNGTGDVSANFTVPMSTSSYAYSAMAGNTAASGPIGVRQVIKSTGSIRVLFTNAAPTAVDHDEISYIVFGDQ